MLAQTFPPVLHYPPPRFQIIAASNNCSITERKKGKPFFHGRARCRIVARAQAPEPAAPEACQRATTGDSGRWPLSERPPIRSLGPVLCTGRVSRSSCRLAAEGQLVVLDQGGERHRALPVAVHLYALAGSGVRPTIGRLATGGVGDSSWLGALGVSCCCPGALWSSGGRHVRSGGEGAAFQRW